ncbi:MAG TPA: hypothetical protein VFW14_10790 [Gaiellales bacterium]|nr:hypothetical protein [Gaiellales bacterium]
MRSSRRRFLVAAAVLGSAVVSGCGGAPAPPRYRWRKGAMDGGGYCNAMAVDPRAAGNAAAAGDIWGEYATGSGGALWYPTMIGATAVDEIYGRAVAYSQLHPGLRYYGIGVLRDRDARGHGYLGAVAPGSLRLERLNEGITFSSDLPVGTAHDVPRAVGHLIAVDHDRNRGIEYLYALSRQGLVRSTDGGSSLSRLGLAAPLPHAAWSALCVCPDGSLLAASFRTSYRSGSQVWRIESPRARPAIGLERAAPAVVEDIAVVDGTVYAACGPYGLYRVDGRAWTAVSPGAFTGCHLSSVAGHSGVLWVGNGIGMTDHRYIARSRDGGRTFVWTTHPAAVSDDVLGAGRRWWLASSWPGLAKDGYSVSQLAVDPDDANACYSAGRAGIVATRNGGRTWQPAMNGLDGSLVTAVQAGPAPAEAWATDTDWTAIHTTDHWRTCTRVADRSRVPPLGAPALVRHHRGRRYQVVLSNPRRMLVDSADVADDYFRSACITPTDLSVSSDGHIYIGLNGGGVLTGARVGP